VIAMTQRLIFEVSSPGKRCVHMPALDVPARPVSELVPPGLLREHPAELPEVSEVELQRHYTGFARRAYGVDTGTYPLGSCTMKYNPKVNEKAASLPGFARLHPHEPAEAVQGALRLMRALEQYLCEIAGMDLCCLQPPAGASGEFTCIRMFKAYHDARGDARRVRVIVPDSAHGTNPASVARCGYTVTQIRSRPDGRVDLQELHRALGDDVAGIMLTNPNTLGLFEGEIRAIAEMVHAAGGLLYCDGANMNAILGVARPGDMGFDAMHFNLHKTFSTPHGGGGPGAGPVCVVERLAPYAPVPRIVEVGGQLAVSDDFPQSIGRVQGFFGNFAVMVRAYAYIRSLGAEGLRRTSEHAVLNANYVMSRIKDLYEVPHGGPCMHEFVASARRQREEHGVRGLDIAKRLMDYGFHPPTMYFPLIVEEALMIEPTETESLADLDRFIEALLAIAKEARDTPDLVRQAPHTMPVSRVDEVTANRRPKWRWMKS
jgi:glycine dehydrogenase subunit 2